MTMMVNRDPESVTSPSGRTGTVVLDQFGNDITSGVVEILTQILNSIEALRLGMISAEFCEDVMDDLQVDENQ